MKYTLSSHREAITIFENSPDYKDLYKEVIGVIESVTDEDIIEAFQNSKRSNIKSISEPINKLLKERFISANWNPESPIFKEHDYTDDCWRLDFAKEKISIEVAFNHGSVVAWNLLKPILASELNHVQKAIQTSAGIIICATNKMKKTGNFDDAIGSYEKYIEYLKPMSNILTAPLLLIGLEAPETFYVDKETKEVVLK